MQMFVIRNLDTGLEMDIDAFDRLTTTSLPEEEVWCGAAQHTHHANLQACLYRFDGQLQFSYQLAACIGAWHTQLGQLMCHYPALFPDASNSNCQPDCMCGCMCV